jgi:SET domain-containing protein
MALPHQGVYARLQPSAIHGIGVFAILPIPSGTYIFEPDDDELVSIPEAEVAFLPEPLRKLYQDFCPKENGEYQCPSSLNRLTPSWFLNHSRQPNVAADNELKFYALRDIAIGEELTSNYSTYSGVEDQIF